MLARRAAILSVIAWILVTVVAARQALVLEERLSYDESAFLREDAESYMGLVKLAESGIGGFAGIAAYETVAVVFKPADLETSRAVEKALAERLERYGGVVVGPGVVYEAVVARVLGELSLALEEAVEKHRLLAETGEAARASALRLSAALNQTLGLADSFLTAYSLAAREGHPDPALYAYEYLRSILPRESLALLDFFYESFRRYEQQLDAREAAYRAAVDLGALLDPALADVIARFSLENYRDWDRIVEYVYNASSAREAMPLGVFASLVEDPWGAARAIVSEELSKIDACMVSAFSQVLAGVEPRVAAGECRILVEKKLAPFPSALPEDFRLTLLSRDGVYGLVVGYSPVKLETEEALELEEGLRRELEGAVEELHLYGTISMKTVRLKVIEADMARVDRIVALSILVTIVVLVGTLAAPLLVFAVTLVALTVSFGAISVAAEFTDVFYLSRLFILPLVFSITADYSIYYLFRVLEEREKGLEWSDAVVEAWRRVSVALAVGGLTGVAGFSAFLLSGHELLESIGVALVIGVGVAFLASLTLTPAVILLVGERAVSWPRSRLSIPARRFGWVFRRVAESSLRARVFVALAALAVLAVAVYSVLTTPVTQNVYLSFPLDSDFVKSSEIIFTNFDMSRFNTMLVVVEEPGDLWSALRELEERGVIARHRVLSVEPLVVELGINKEPLGDGSRRVVLEVRRVLREHGVEAYVTGMSPLLTDAVDGIISSFYERTVPIALALVALVIGILVGSVFQPPRLLVTAVFALFCSLAVTMTASRLLIETPGFTEFESLLYWVLPIILWGFAISTGVDFEAFLTTRVMEEYRRQRSVDASVLEAVEKTGVVITVLAVIYIVAFGSLLASSIPLLKMIGLSIALFFLVDAFAARLLVVPAFFSILGRLNWWPRER